MAFITVIGNLQLGGGIVVRINDDGSTTVLPGGSVPGSEIADTYMDIKHTANIVKDATQLKDVVLRDATVRAAAEYFGRKAKDKVLGPNGNVIAIF